ncbi:hypothetical protein B0H16DRAFT_1577418 [Mycena metata]|uniref:Chromo domain-containing protein n=1 Tax=Mycena metata TaxID=1033252 RepID=A0AAD7I4D6_9AGAR|nr:hypothetical protein B0H16DRAFT_1577418 [Mycena metata]
MSSPRPPRIVDEVDEDDLRPSVAGVGAEMDGNTYLVNPGSVNPSKTKATVRTRRPSEPPSSPQQHSVPQTSVEVNASGVHNTQSAAPQVSSPEGRPPVIVVHNPYPVQELDEMAEHRFIAGHSYVPAPSKGANFVPELYGRPVHVVAEKPPLMSEEFMWGEDVMSQAPRPAACLAPAPAAAPPHPYTYPKADPYTCNETVDKRWARGYCYTTLFTPSEKGLLRERLLKTKTPPLLPRVYEGKLVIDPIAGMIQMPGSVPFVQHTKDHPDEAVTLACAHSLASIRSVYPDIADEVENLSLQLRDATFGRDAENGEPPIIPIYAIPGLNRNARSVDAKKLPPGSFDGSYNLASTRGEGEGAGVTMPAVQASTPEATERITLVLRLLHAIQRLILPRSISKFEYDVTEAHSKLNNVVSFGGLEPNGTSCQMNVSSAGYDLTHFIGEHQGAWHTDIGDDWTRWTTVTMLLKLPEGSDPGAFCLARCGLYIREVDAWIVFLVFRGNDLHSGFSPTMPPIPRSEVNDLLRAPGVIRVVYVNYPSRVATTRSGSMSMTPATNFGNYGSTSAAKAEQRHYSDATSTPIFSSVRVQANWLAREAAQNFQNALAWSGLKLNVGMTKLLSSMSYNDPQLGETHVEAPVFDLELHKDQMSRWWRFYEWHRYLCKKYLILITKDEFRTAQAQLASYTMDAPAVPYTQLDRAAISAPSPDESLANSGQAPEHIVDAVLDRRIVEGVTRWTLKLDAQEEPSIITGFPSWAHHPLNAPKFAQFVAASQISGVNSVDKHTIIDEDVDMPDASSSLVAPVASAEPEHPPITVLGDDEVECILAPHLVQQRLAAVTRLEEVITTSTQPSASSSEGGGSSIQATARRSGRAAAQKESVLDLDVGEWVVEAIMDIDLTEMEPLWRVRWEGFNSDDDTWENLTALVGARKLLDEFNESISYEMPTLHSCLLSSRFSSVESEFRPAEPARNSKKRPLLPDSEVEEEPQEDELEDLEETLDMESASMADLDKLFDADYRRLEAEALATTEESLHRSKNYYGPSTTSSMVETLVTQNEYQTQFNDYMMFVPKSAQQTPQWTQHSAVLSLNRIIQATAVLPELATDVAKTSILDRSLRWEMARSNMLLYGWYRETGVLLARTLVDAHRKGGFPGLDKAHPLFSRFVHHIFSYVLAQSEDRKATKKQRRQNPDAPQRRRKAPEPLHPPSSFEVNPSELGSLPYDLYGLREASKKTRVPLRLPTKCMALDTPEALYKCTENLIQDVWSNELILPPVVSMDKALAIGKRKYDSTALVRDRAIARGAVLQCIVDACGGDESILASSDMENLLGSPAKIFPERIQKESKFAAAVLKNPEKTLAPLTEWLAARLDSSPHILDYAARTARIVHRGLLELHYGISLRDEHFLNPDMLYDESEDVPFIAPALNRQSSRKKNQYYCPPTPDSLLPDPNAPYFGAIGLVLRERLNEMREFSAGDPVLRNVLQGRHPTQGREQFDRDQTDPARQFSEYAKLICKALPGAKLTGHLGISRLLAYMGTGQGNKTREFVESGDGDGMLFDDLASCVSHFRDTEVENMSLLTDFRTKLSSRAAHLPGFKRTYNACIWGQASNHMLLQPTIGKPGHKRRCTIDEKFTPYFTSEIQTKWVSFLGDMFGHDPATYQGTKPSWADGLRFILDLRVVGFQSGLTPLQFANNLVFLGICQAPEPQEVADWIASNKSLGAYNGLVKLGFVLTGYSSIIAAYMIVFQHLDTYLSGADKAALGFSALFVEHLLCKVGRWEYRLRLQRLDFNRMAAHAVQSQASGGGWVSGANLSPQNYLLFPLPLTLDHTTLAATIKSHLALE